MYHEFFGVEEAPFNLTPDPRFLFMSQRHREAIAALMYGINERKGFIALTGEIGSGKTTICRALMNELAGGTKVSYILNPALSSLELLQAINTEYGIEHESESKKKLIDELNKFLLEQRTLGNTVLLIIDESQNLEPDVLEQIRLISNLETETEKLIQIVLMGQPELQETLALPELEQLNQRITVKYHITPLIKEEVGQYIRHRLFVARAKVELVIEPEALDVIFEQTRGIPRRVNVLMDRVMLASYVEGTNQVTPDTVRRALAEVEGPAGSAAKTKTKTKAPRRAGGDRRWVRAALAMGATAAIAAAAGVAALHFINMPGSSTGIAVARPSPGVSALLPQLPSGGRDESAPVAYAGDTGAEVTAVATDNLAPPPRITASGAPVDPWVYDQSGIVRVLDPADSWHASLITLMSISSLQQYELMPLRGAAPEQVQRFVETLYSDLSASGHRQVRLGGSLASLLRIDVPMVLALADDLENLSPFLVLMGATEVGGEEVLILLDPVQGLLNVSRVDLGPIYVGPATALYPDPLGLTELSEGARGDAVTQLQRALFETGHYAGDVTGFYDPTTREAVRDFQRDRRLATTGSIDVTTALHLSTIVDPGEQEAVQ